MGEFISDSRSRNNEQPYRLSNFQCFEPLAVDGTAADTIRAAQQAARAAINKMPNYQVLLLQRLVERDGVIAHADDALALSEAGTPLKPVDISRRLWRARKAIEDAIVADQPDCSLADARNWSRSVTFLRSALYATIVSPQHVSYRNDPNASRHNIDATAHVSPERLQYWLQNLDSALQCFEEISARQRIVLFALANAAGDRDRCIEILRELMEHVGIESASERQCPTDESKQKHLNDHKNRQVGEATLLP